MVGLKVVRSLKSFKYCLTFARAPCKAVIFNQGAVSRCQALQLVFRPINPSRGIAKYLLKGAANKKKFGKHRSKVSNYRSNRYHYISKSLSEIVICFNKSKNFNVLLQFFFRLLFSTPRKTPSVTFSFGVGRNAKIRSSSIVTVFKKLTQQVNLHQT